MLDFTYSKDDDGNIVSKNIFDPLTGKFIETVTLSDEEREELNKPNSQFENISAGEVFEKTQTEKEQEPEASFAQDLQRIGLKTVFGPVQLASDLIVRPFSSDKEAYDKAANKWLQESQGKVLTAFGEDNISDVIDPNTGRIRSTDTIAGTVVNLGTYAVGGGVVFKALNKINQAKKLGTVGKLVVAEQVAEQALSNPNEGNIANLLSTLNIPIIDPALEYLSADEDDDVLLNRAKMSIASGVSGAVVGSLAKLGFSAFSIKKYSKEIFNKDPEELSHDIELPEVIGHMLKHEKAAQIQKPNKIVESTQKVSRDTNEGVIQALKQSENSLTGRVQWLKQRFFTSRGFFSKEAFKAKEIAVSSTKQLVSSGVHHARRLQRFIDDELLATKDETLANRVMEQLKNKSLRNLPDEEKIKRIVDSGLSEDIAIEIVSARSIIDDLSNYIVDNNVTTEGVREAIQNNIGSYVTRSYRLYDDPTYVPSNSVKEEAIDSIAQGLGAKLSPEEFNRSKPKLLEEAEEKVKEILDVGEVANLNDYISRIRAINKKVFVKRKDISPEIRKLMGEVTSPTETISLTIQKLANITENYKFYNKLNQLGGSVPANPVAYKQSLKQARDQLEESAEFKELKEQLDIIIPKGTLFRLNDKETGSFISINEKNVGKEIRVKVRDSETGELLDDIREISLEEAKKGFIPKSKVVKKVADEIYVKKYNGTMTSDTYLKTKKSDVFNTQIAGTNSEIDGLFTTPELARAINDLEDTHFFWGFFKNGFKQNELGRYLSGAKGLSQQMKTVYDHTTHLRNALGGYQFGLANGINPLTQGKFNQAALWNEIFEGNNRIFDAYYERLQGLGVINTSVRARETRAMLDIASEARGPDVLARKIESLSKKYPTAKLIRKPEQIYMATDDFFKMNAFAAELSSLKKSKPNAPLQQLEEEAAEIVRNTLPNYDRVTQGVKALREAPIGNFVSFPAEIIRTSYHIVRQGTKEAVEGFSTGNVALRNRGMQRLVGFTALNSAWFGTGYLGSKALGLTDKENQSYQTLLETKFDDNRNKVILNIGGRFYNMSPTYINSYNIFQDAALNIHQELAEGRFKGETLSKRLGDATIGALSAVIQPFTEEAMFIETMGDIYTAIKDEQGRTPAGKQIIKDSNDPWSIAWGSLTHAGKQFTPGFVTDFKKFGEALFEVPDPYTGQKRSFGARSVEMLSGLNFTEFNPENRFIRKAREYNRLKNYARTKPTARFGKKSDDYFGEYTNYTAKKFEAAQNFYRNVQAMQDLGFSDRRIVTLMEKAGLTSRSENKLMLKGKFSADTLTKRQKIDMIGKLKNEGEENPSKLIQDFLNFANRLNLSAEGNEAREAMNQEIFKQMSADEFRKNFKKGGEVDVPDAKKEPDERVDRMTGLPYNIQAGTLGIDQEDPEKRLLSNTGGMLLARLKKTRQRKTVGGQILKLFFKDVMTPVKKVGRGSEAKIIPDPEKPTVVRTTEELTEQLNPRVQRAIENVDAQSITPIPGSFVDEKSVRYKGEGFKKMLEGQGVDIDLDLGNYVIMGKVGKDVTDKTFQNLLISARTSKKFTEGVNKPLAKVNIYDAEDLTIDQMKKNYRDNTGIKTQPMQIETNLVQPELFKIIVGGVEKRLDHPIVTIQSSAAKMKQLGFKTDHGYALDVQFVGPVKMTRLTKRDKKGKIPQPNLRPETVGTIKKGRIIGQIKTSSGKIHDLYDYIEVDATPSLGKDVTIKEKFYRGGKVQRALLNARR